ncbi:hypothetical protein, partial [Streptomyces sp. NPDC003015]
MVEDTVLDLTDNLIKLPPATGGTGDGGHGGSSGEVRSGSGRRPESRPRVRRGNREARVRGRDVRGG